MLDFLRISLDGPAIAIWFNEVHLVKNSVLFMEKDAMKATINFFSNLSSALLFAVLATSAQADSPGNVRVRGLTYAGSGCPAGTVSTNISPDALAFTVMFDAYAAEVGPGVPYGQKRKNCQLGVDLDVPNGWTYSILTVDTRGYVSLEPGVRALQRSSYYFQGQGQTAGLNTVMIGPTDRNYQVRDLFPVNSVVWAPCGASRALNLSTEVRVENTQNPYAHGLATIDSLDGQFRLIYGVQWRRCS